jgi:hypothetical protein
MFLTTTIFIILFISEINGYLKLQIGKEEMRKITLTDKLKKSGKSRVPNSKTIFNQNEKKNENYSVITCPWFVNHEKQIQECQQVE